MPEPSPSQTLRSITRVTTWLVEHGLSDREGWPKLVGNDFTGSVTTANAVDSSVLRDVKYEDLYDDQLRLGAFNSVLLDGAILQLSYDFKARKLVRHRLAYLPSPRLLDYQNLPELYLHETPFVDIVGSQVVAVPVRFDYDARDGVVIDEMHPAAHLTLGQYKHCRIPVSAPVTPAVFVDFIVRHFYWTPDTVPIVLDRDLESAFAYAAPAIDPESMHIVSPGRR